MSVVALRGRNITPAVLVEGAVEHLDSIEMIIQIVVNKDGNVMIGHSKMGMNDLSALSMELQGMIFEAMGERNAVTNG